MSKVEKRTDPFLPYLRKLIHQKQNERTTALQLVSALDREIATLEAERDRRIGEKIDFSVPDFPPEDIDKPIILEIEKFEQESIDHVVQPESLDGVSKKTKAHKEATLKLVRDWAAKNGKDWFRTGYAATELELSRGIVSHRCSELVEMGVLEHRGNKASSMFRYKPIKESTAKRAKAKTQKRKMPASAAVPGTGKRAQKGDKNSGRGFARRALKV
jgi:hypothetical protein